MGSLKILMASYHPWNSPIQVGSHHLAREFVKLGHQVAFISDPISPFHFLPGMGHNMAERLELNRPGGQWDLGGRLWAYVPAAPFTFHPRPPLNSRWIARNWWKMTLPSAVEMVARNGFGDVDLVYIESVFQYFWLGKVRHRRSVYRMADNPEGWTKMALEPVRDLIQALALTVSAVAYTARELEPYVLSLRPYHHFYLPNGVQYSHFAGGKPGLPVEYKKIPEPRAVYVGSMEDWFDFELVRKTARAHPSLSFVLIGPNKIAAKKLSGIPNIHLLGPRKYEGLPAYLRHADLGIIPNNVWDRPHLTHYMNPLKLYQYLACGLPVVASTTRTLKDLKSPAFLAKDRVSFVRLVGEVLAKSRKSRVAMDYAKKRDWSQAAKDLLKKVR